MSQRRLGAYTWVSPHLHSSTHPLHIRRGHPSVRVRRRDAVPEKTCHHHRSRPRTETAGSIRDASEFDPLCKISSVIGRVLVGEIRATRARGFRSALARRTPACPSPTAPDFAIAFIACSISPGNPRSPRQPQTTGRSAFPRHATGPPLRTCRGPCRGSSPSSSARR